MIEFGRLGDEARYCAIGLAFFGRKFGKFYGAKIHFRRGIFVETVFAIGNSAGDLPPERFGTIPIWAAVYQQFAALGAIAQRP